jgi:hypothetical protein
MRCHTKIKVFLGIKIETYQTYFEFTFTRADLLSDLTYYYSNTFRHFWVAIRKVKMTEGIFFIKANNN